MKRSNSRNTATPHAFYIESDSASLREDDLSKLTHLLNNGSAILSKLELYSQARKVSGNAVLLDQRFGFLPVLVGSDSRPIPLYEFVEVIDDVLDYDDILAEFPTLSFGQIAGAIAFLRKLVQFNSKGLDIDRLEDDAIEGDKDFQAIIVKALADTEVARVRPSD